MYYKNTIFLLNICLVVSLLAPNPLGGQIPGPEGSQVFGNEWIDYDKTYLRLPVGEDGWYTIGQRQLLAAGWSVDDVSGTSLIMYRNGEQIPLLTSTDGVFTPDDQILFYGWKNRTELEDFIYHNPARQMLNPRYSLFTDTAVYFLTVDPESSKQRFQRTASNQGSQVNRVTTETEVVYTDKFYTQASQGIIDPDFNDLEGFATGFARTVTREIDMKGINPLGDSMQIEIGVGANLNTRNFSIFINDQLAGEYQNELVQSARQITFAWPVTDADQLSIKIEGKGEQERLALAYIRVRHEVTPEDLDTAYHSTFTFDHNDTPFGITIPEETPVERIFNLTQGIYSEGMKNGAVQEFYLTGIPGDDYVLQTIPRSVRGIRAVQFQNYLDQEFDYLIITSDALRNSGGEPDAIDRYAQYRSSDAGGQYKVGVVTIEQLRDQYIYGILGHPYAIRNFAGQLLATQHGVRYINIIGKGMAYGYLRSGADKQKYYYKTHFVPTLGHYGSDNLLVSTKGDGVPQIPIGRVPATHPDEIDAYLEKVKTYESVLQNPGQNEDREWMKRVMHFNGGDRDIFSVIANFMDGLGDEIQRDSFAAQVISYYKSSFGSTDIPERDEIFSYINEGAALISFFGHSASSSLDFNIDIIGEYENAGRLPVFLALGCSSGNIFLPNKNLAERFVLTPDIGSVLFLSTASSQYLSNLQRLARAFYDEIGSDQYGHPLGDIVKGALDALGNSQKHLQSVFVFAGDPAVAAYHFEGPDFTFEDESVKLNPARPSLVDDKFTMEVTIQNLGIRMQDSFPVLVRQVLPDGRNRMLDTVWASVPGFDQTITVELPVTDDMEGKNTYYLTIDPDNQIDEYPAGAGETNNTLRPSGQEGYDVFIQNTTLQLIYPYDNAIIPDPQPVLEIFNGNVEPTPKTYLIELDTTPYFTSPAYRTFTRTSNQARVVLPVDQSLEAEVVYYWRARWSQDSIFTPYQSFIYLEDQTGWNQSHYGQFHQDSLVNITEAERKLEFARLQNLYKLDHGNKKAAIIFNEIERPRFFRTTYPALNVSIFKPRKNAWVNNPKPGLYNSIWPVAKDEYLYTFVYRPYSEVHRASIIELIEEEAEPGDYVIFWNTTRGSRSPAGETWAQDSITHEGVNLFNYFENEGASQIRALADEDRRAYSLIYQKGEGVVTEILGDSAGVNIEYVDLYSFDSKGSLWSGDVEILSSIDRYESSVSATGSDSVEMVFSAGDYQENFHFDQTTSSLQSGTFSGADPPSFTWQANMSDVEDRTLPLFYWRVLGSFRPDWRITNTAGQVLIDTAALESNQLSVYFEVSKSGDVEADSILVSMELFNGSRTIEKHIYVSSDKWGQQLHYQWPLGPEYQGGAVLKVTVDPDNDWAETDENNNAIFRNFDIRGDRLAPTVEVLFDQQTILNGDIIAPDALITVRMADFPNNNLTLEPDFEFEIKNPSGEVVKIDIGDPKLTLKPADEGIELEYQSDFDENGLYELKVNVRDVVGNSQASDYHIDFEVVLENSVSAILPYPNPFVDAVRFAYTLTGSDEPEVFRIMIYTVSGRLVKEITKAEFGPMRTGRHLSEYVWDGTDRWNQELAPGVYLYKVLSRDQAGEDYKKYQIGELEQGNYFKNGIGKMVKLR